MITPFSRGDNIGEFTVLFVLGESLIDHKLRDFTKDVLLYQVNFQNFVILLCLWSNKTENAIKRDSKNWKNRAKRFF